MAKQRGERAPAPRLPIVPPGLDLVAFALLACGIALLYVPAYAELARTI